MRVIIRAERPHPGAQLRFTDCNGHRLTGFVTNSRRGQLRRWEPKRLRLRIFATAGRHARQTRLHLPRHAPWRHLVTTALSRIHAPPAGAA